MAVAKQRVSLLTMLLPCFVIAALLYGHGLGAIAGLPQAGAAVQHQSPRQLPEGNAAPAKQGFRMPPQLPPLWNATADSIVADMKALIEQDRAFTDRLVQQVQPEEATFENVMIPSAQQNNRISLQWSILTMFNSISTDKALRDASTEAQKLISQYSTESSQRQDIFDLIKAVFERKDQDLDPESQRLLEFTYKDYIQSGMGLPAGRERDHYRNISDRINDLESQFGNNLSGDNSSLWLTQKELDGAPQDTVATFEKGKGENQGKLRLVLPSPDVYTIFKYLKNPEVRKRIHIATERRVPENIPIFDKTVILRDEGARLLGYPNHAAYRLEDRLLNTTEAVNDFLRSVRQRLTPIGKDEIKNLTKLKEADTQRPDENEDRFFIWDQSYYERRFQDENYNLDPQKITEYFPSTVVVKKLLGIYEELFGLEFVEVKGEDRDKISASGNGSDIIWHPDVQLFTVWDSEEEGSDFVGYLYLDLFFRENKYSGAANFDIQPSFLDLDNNRTRHHSVTSLICNFPKPTANKPSLMSHDDVTVIFHELGHGIHNLVSRTTYSRFSGAQVLWDFVEAPSQMLENWAWTPAVLRDMSLHYSYLSDEYKKAWQDSTNAPAAQQPKKHMPDQMIKNLILNKNYDVALNNLDQIVIGAFDMTVHTPASHEAIETLPITETWNRDQKKIGLLNGPEALIADESKKWKWGHGYTRFGHLMAGYDAGYYAYLNAKVYAEDMFYTAFRKDPFSSTQGRRYRHTVLEKGGSVDPMKLLTNFLGRAPNQKAFYQDMGLD